MSEACKRFDGKRDAVAPLSPQSLAQNLQLYTKFLIYLNVPRWVAAKMFADKRASSQVHCNPLSYGAGKSELASQVTSWRFGSANCDPPPMLA
jgi:hypothetical protein